MARLTCRAAGMSKMLMDVLPMIDPEDSTHCGTSSVRSLRNLIIQQDKKPFVTRILDSLKKADISRPSISINRGKALLEGSPDPSGERSIFGQIYLALGARATTAEIFRGAERWWSVSFIGEHVSDAGDTPNPLAAACCHTIIFEIDTSAHLYLPLQPIFVIFIHLCIYVRFYVCLFIYVLQVVASARLSAIFRRTSTAVERPSSFQRQTRRPKRVTLGTPGCQLQAAWRSITMNL